MLRFSEAHKFRTQPRDCNSLTGRICSSSPSDNPRSNERCLVSVTNNSFSKFTELAIGRKSRFLHAALHSSPGCMWQGIWELSQQTKWHRKDAKRQGRARPDLHSSRSGSPVRLEPSAEMVSRDCFLHFSCSAFTCLGYSDQFRQLAHSSVTTPTVVQARTAT
jgi:hypothetical protein